MSDQVEYAVGWVADDGAVSAVHSISSTPPYRYVDWLNRTAKDWNDSRESRLVSRRVSEWEPVDVGASRD